MKKAVILGASLMLAFAASAQVVAVKEIANSFKTNSGAAEQALKDMQPYLQNPETNVDPATWVVAAKAGVAVYDHIYLQGTLGNVPNDDAKRKAGRSLNSAYEYLYTALPLDSVADAKGKIKTKYSKDIIKMLRDNYNGLKQAGIWLYEAGDYPGAAKSWEYYIQLPNQPFMEKSGLVADNDTIQGQLMSYQSLALLLDKRYPEALEVARRVRKTGYDSMDVYRYGLAAAQEVADTAAIIEFATEGAARFGAEDNELNFIGNLINVAMARNDAASAEKLVDQALISCSPENIRQKASLYNLKGTINENNGNLAEAKTQFNAAVDIDPTFGKAVYDKGRMIYNDAIQQDDAADESTRQSVVIPMFLEAAGLFEQAYDLDSNLSQIPGVLYRLYYRIEGEDSDNTLKWKLMQ